MQNARLIGPRHHGAGTSALLIPWQPGQHELPCGTRDCSPPLADDEK